MVAQLDFDELIDRRETDCTKWRRYGPDVIPLWVADMDFRSPQPVVDALRERAEHGIFGYGYSSWSEDGSMDHLLERQEDIVLYECPSGAAVYSGGIVLMNAGCRRGVWEDFKGEMPKTRLNGSDQAWISWYLDGNEATFGPEDGVYFQRNYEGQENACIVFLSGRADPRFPPWSEMEWVQQHYR